MDQLVGLLMFIGGLFALCVSVLVIWFAQEARNYRRLYDAETERQGDIDFAETPAEADRAERFWDHYFDAVRAGSDNPMYDALLHRELEDELAEIIAEHGVWGDAA
jgi:hypothetical protein